MKRDAVAILMRSAGQLMWPEKYDCVRKNNRHQLHNDLIGRRTWDGTKRMSCLLESPLLHNLVIFFGSLMVIIPNWQRNSVQYHHVLMSSKDTTVLKATSGRDQTSTEATLLGCHRNYLAYFNRCVCVC